MKSFQIISACAVLALCCCKAEEANKDQQPQRGSQADQGGGRRGAGFGGNDWAGGAGGMVVGGRGGGPGFGGVSNTTAMSSRMLGVDLDQLKKNANTDQLPLLDSRRFVTKIPVGGVDSFSMNGSGWKMEGVFKLTPEQSKAVDTIRDEYAVEQKKLAREIYEQELKLAQKVSELRAKYEQKANDVLTAEDKDAKQKMDALSLEIQTKINTTVKDAAELYDLNDQQQTMAFVQSMREKVNAFYQSGEDKLTALLPAEARAKIEEMNKRQAEQQQNGFGGARRGFNAGGGNVDGGGGGGGAGGRGGRGDHGGRGGDTGAAVTPPKAPADQF